MDSKKKEVWLGCALCGLIESPPDRLHVVFTVEGVDTKTCRQCKDLYWYYHQVLKSEQSDPTGTRWTHKVKCLASRQLLQDAEISDQAGEFKKSVETLNVLKGKLSDMYKSLELAAKNDPNCAGIQEWAKKFDLFMQDLNNLYAADFATRLLEHVKEFHEKKVPDQDLVVIALFKDVKLLLRALVKNMPMNKLLYEHRELLKSVLGFDKYSEDKFVLTLDGGGIKGVLTVHVLKAIRERLREKTGIKDLQITDCFDLAIGTSTGGVIVGCMCAAMMDLEEILDLYTTLAKEVFSESNKTDLRYSVACRYADDPMIRILTDLFQTKRLDDPGITFQNDKNNGPDGIRFGFTAVDVSTSRPRTLLFRNYQKFLRECCKTSDSSTTSSGYLDQESRTEGTDGCFIAEAIRCTASAPGIIHPYSRFYPPLEIHYSTWTSTYKTQYRMLRKDAPYTHARIFLDQAPFAMQEKLRKRMEQDTLMESGVVVIDGGLAANNPAVLALNEAYSLWGDVENTGIRVLSIGTGKLPVQINPTWNKSIIRPLNQKFTGTNNYREVISDLIKYTYVSAATETEETTGTMNRFGSLVASYRRINPELLTNIEMDDTSPEAIQILIGSARTWINSNEGKATIESTVDEICTNSSRLKRRLADMMTTTTKIVSKKGDDIISS